MGMRKSDDDLFTRMSLTDGISFTLTAFLEIHYPKNLQVIKIRVEKIMLFELERYIFLETHINIKNNL